MCTGCRIFCNNRFCEGLEKKIALVYIMKGTLKNLLLAIFSNVPTSSVVAIMARQRTSHFQSYL